MSSRLRERLRSLNYSRNGSRAGQANRSIVITVIALLAIALVVALIFIAPRTGIGAGKAVQQTTPGVYQFVSGDINKGIKFENTVYYADPDDTLNLVVYMTSDAPINHIDYEIEVSSSNLIVTPAGCDTGTNYLSLDCGIVTYQGLSSLDRTPTDPIWSVYRTGSGITGSNIKMFSIPFKVQSASIGDTIIVTLNNIYLRDADDSSIKYGPITATATVNVVDLCIDTDGDGRGAVDTELRACPTPNVGDCDDTKNNVYPGKAELCDGLDNDCANGVDNGLVGEPNTNTLGVCWGNQFCKGVNGWVDSYTATDAEITAAGLTPVAFTDPSGTAATQQQLYSTTTELCDFFDNDCDGSINEEITGCTLGSSLVGLPPGNVLIDYNSDNTHASPQLITTNEGWLLNKMQGVIIDTACGAAGQLPCERPWTATVNIHICESGTYYLENSVGGEVRKYSPTDDLTVGLSITDIVACE